MVPGGRAARVHQTCSSEAAPRKASNPRQAPLPTSGRHDAHAYTATMPRWFTVVLIICLSLDFSLAGNCIMCRDTDGAVYGLSGSTTVQAKQQAQSVAIASSSSRSDKDKDCECKHCQLDCAQATHAELPVVANGPQREIVPIERAFSESAPVFRIERPKWFPSA